ncbi:MAG: hypothetical protein HGA65_01925, partial [Oscillochloris sp.]|nr:hypothetical protein [Oscillochloris sp.]
MRRWKAQITFRLWLAAALMVVATLGAIFFFVRIATVLARAPEQWPINLGIYLQLLAGLALLLVAGMVAYRLAAALTLGYGVDRNGFYIFWVGNRAVIPLSQIESIDVGAALVEKGARLSQSVAYYYGRTQISEGRLAERFSTLPTAQSLILHTPGLSYVISPDNRDTFVQELEQRRRLGAIQQLIPGVDAGRTFFYAFWNDLVVRRALLIAIALGLGLLGWLAAIYPGLPTMIDLRTDAAGMAAALRPRHQILFLPLAANAILLINAGFGLSLYGRTPAGARMLQIASAFMQILFAVAIL